MPNVLIIYATREGQTAKIAGEIARRLGIMGAAVELINAKDRQSLKQISLKNRDLIVFGASMHAGRIEPELRRFINRNTHIIQNITRSFFLVLLSAATADLELKNKWLLDAREKLHAQLEVEFNDNEMIAGALNYVRYSRPVRWLMKSIALQVGADIDTSKNYEYTDWGQVNVYAERLMGLTEKRDPSG